MSHPKYRKTLKILQGHKVGVGVYIRAESLEHLQVFFPDYWYRNELNLLDQGKKVIYDGKTSKATKFLLGGNVWIL